MKSRRNMLRVLCTLLCLLMLATVLAACDEKKDGGVTTTPKTTTTTDNGGGGDDPVARYDENGYLLDNIDREGIDYGDITIHVLAWLQNKSLLFPEEMVDGEALSNDVYLRNRQIEADLGIKFNPTFKSSHMSTGNDGADLFNEALEGKTAYETIVCYSHYPAKLALEGRLEDINSLDFPQKEMPWYPEGVSSWGIMGRQFFIANNSCVQNILASWCIFANKTMIANKSLKSIEEVVIEGDWTLATLKTYSRNWAAEAEGNASKDEEDRVYGFALTHRTCIDGFYHAAGFDCCVTDDEGNPAYAYHEKEYIERVSDFMDIFLDITDSPEFMMGPYLGDIYYPLENKNAVFFAASLDSYQRLDDYTYCMIPMPKLDDQQEDYRTLLRDISELWCVPTGNVDPELGGLIIEATASSDYRLMAPKFFDHDFKYRYSTDDNGVKIFELIRSSYVTDFGAVWISVGSPYGALRNCIDHTPNDDPLNTLENTFATAIGGSKLGQVNTMRNFKKMLSNLYPES